MDPTKRITSEAAMQDSYFQEEPRPSVELVHYFTYLNSFFLSVAPFSELCVQLPVVLSLVLWEPHDCWFGFRTGVPRRQPHHRSGLATLSSVGAVR